MTGAVAAAAAEECRSGPGTIVAGGAGDNAAAAVGTGVVSAGRAFTTLGTSGVIFAHFRFCDHRSQGRVRTFCSAVPGAWTVMSCTLAAGLSCGGSATISVRLSARAAAAMGTRPL